MNRCRPFPSFRPLYRRTRAGLLATAMSTVVSGAVAGLCLTAPALQAQEAATPDPAPDLRAPPPGGAAGDWFDPKFTPLPPVSLNFYGLPGAIDMPSAEMMPDGQGALSLGYFAGIGRLTAAFQLFPWMTTSFRYTGLKNLDRYGFDTYWDRSFDVRVRLLKEGTYRPELTVGLQDFAGTGFYSGEYVVATKGFDVPALGQSRRSGRIKVSAGLGWGRLGSYGSIGSSGERPAYDETDSEGGELGFDQWFRGPYAPFGLIEWRVNDKWGVKAEYSSDAYVNETTAPSNLFERKSSFNFGVEYQASERWRLGGYYLYGDKLGFSAQLQFNPKYPATKTSVPAPQPITPRPARAAAPDAWSTSWSSSTEVKAAYRTALAEPLAANGLVLESLTLTPTQAVLRYKNARYGAAANGVGRAARVMAQVLPASVETFVLVPVTNGMSLSAVTLRRSDLEALEFAPEATAGLRAVAGLGEAPLGRDPAALPAEGLYPDFSWSLGPYFEPGYFDPSVPFRLDVGAQLSATYRPAPGWVASGTLRYKIAGDLDGGRPSNSVLPHVRTDQNLYAQYDFTMNNLFGARYWRPGTNLYARLTGGYLESMYGGLSGEVLWAPVTNPLSLGLEVNAVKQRAFDQGFGFQDYEVMTGHATAYMELGRGYLATVSAGRYLAGDVGATFSFNRVFANGWEVGAFFTKTDVSAEEFGEGSFDKGISFRIPLNWFLGKPTRNGLGTVIRPIQRDGGQMVSVPGRLYGQVRDSHARALDDTWARVWE